METPVFNKVVGLPFLYPLKASENQRFSFSGYRGGRPVAPLKRNFNKDIFSWNLQNFQEYLFLENRLFCCFKWLKRNQSKVKKQLLILDVNPTMQD